MGLARRFAREGYPIALVGRSEDGLRRLVGALAAEGYPARPTAMDVADFAALRGAIGQITQTLGPVGVLLYNAAGYGNGDGLHQDPEGLADDFRVSAAGFLAAVQAVAPAMMERRQGSILATGGGVVHRPSYEYPSLGVGKTALRYLVLSLAPTLARHGVQAAIVNVNGPIREGTHFSPDLIAGQFWQIHRQPPGASGAEVEYT
jgi:NAD(P)-dependent dehydrogenase (short-subunit alcohol dehydrogenase family)